MRGVEFLYDFMKKKPNAEPDSAEVAAEELATAMEDAAAAGEAAKEKNENAIKVLALASKDVVELHVEVVTWIKDSVKVGFREWLREGTGADFGDYKQHFSVGKRDRLAQTAMPTYCSLRITVAKVLSSVVESCILGRIEDKMVTYFIDGAPDLGPLPPSTQGRSVLPS